MSLVDLLGRLLVSHPTVLSCPLTTLIYEQVSQELKFFFLLPPFVKEAKVSMFTLY